MRTMRKGEIAWIRFSKQYHRGIYHNSSQFQAKPQEVKDKIGLEYIYIRFEINNVKRLPAYLDEKTFLGRMDYYEKVRDVGKMLMREKEYTNAK